MNDIDKLFYKLALSKFRSSFHLSKKLRDYVLKHGYETIERHADDFLHQRLKVYNAKTDGHQTPMKNHPVFIAQHATATCCRGCMEKWYHIPKERDLTEEEIAYFKKIIMRWIRMDYERDKTL